MSHLYKSKKKKRFKTVLLVHSITALIYGKKAGEKKRKKICYNSRNYTFSFSMTRVNS